MCRNAVRQRPYPKRRWRRQPQGLRGAANQSRGGVGRHGARTPRRRLPPGREGQRRRTSLGLAVSDAPSAPIASHEEVGTPQTPLYPAIASTATRRVRRDPGGARTPYVDNGRLGRSLPFCAEIMLGETSTPVPAETPHRAAPVRSAGQFRQPRSRTVVRAWRVLAHSRTVAAPICDQVLRDMRSAETAS